MPWVARAGQSERRVPRALSPGRARLANLGVVTPTSVSFFARVALAIRVIFDKSFALRVAALRTEGRAALPAPDEARALPEPPQAPASVQPKVTAPVVAQSTDGALAVLALLQREGRLVDFLQQDIAAFSDADIGAAARVVHEGCRKALSTHADIERVRTEPEGTAVTLPAGFDAQAFKLVGDIRGDPPYRGVLRHSGWRARSIRLPDRVAGHDPSVLAPAEVEL